MLPTFAPEMFESRTLTRAATRVERMRDAALELARYHADTTFADVAAMAGEAKEVLWDLAEMVAGVEDGRYIFGRLIPAADLAAAGLEKVENPWDDVRPLDVEGTHERHAFLAELDAAQAEVDAEEEEEDRIHPGAPDGFELERGGWDGPGVCHFHGESVDWKEDVYGRSWAVCEECGAEMDAGSVL